MSYNLIDHKKKVEEKQKYLENDNTVIALQKKYFLLCGNCFWMASTLPHLLDEYLFCYRKCLICKNELDRFLICNDENVWELQKLTSMNYNNIKSLKLKVVIVESILLSYIVTGSILELLFKI
jgi:hypothetical protein